MKPLLFTLVLALTASILPAAEPTTVKEVFAQELAWKINERTMDPREPLSSGTKLLTRESAFAFLTRIAAGRSDADRKLAAKITKANWSALDVEILTPAGKVAGDGAPKVKALRTALERIAESPAADARDQAEVARLLANLR